MSATTGSAVRRLPVLGAPLRRRPLVVGALLAAACLALAVLALGTGDYPLTPLQVVQAALDPGAGFARTIVLEWRMPRVLAALAFGAALGASGAVFQSLTRNPLGSPDVIGFSTGAYTGALLVLTVGGVSSAFASATGSATGATGGGSGDDGGRALAGGLLTALAVYALARVRGAVQGYRLVVVGIAATAVLHAANTYLLLRAQTEVAMAGAVWGAGSLSTTGWGDLTWALGALVVLVPALVLLAPALRQLELGDDAASAHGVRVERARLGLVVVGVALVSVVTASSGPIAFVALAAPQVARLLLRGPGLSLVGSALVGALLLVSADQVAQRLLSGVPVGVVTVVGGGAYLLVLLLVRGPVEREVGVSERLEGRGLRLAYDGRVVAEDLSLAVPDGSFTVVVGPNACGKSTLLRAFSRLLRPQAGAVVLDGAAIASYRPKEAARRVGLLPQSATAPEGITVGDLVARGRYPHQGLVRQWSAADEVATTDAMLATGVEELRDRLVDDLSGGQRQRVWVAVALAQQTPLLLLDEPTTYLDVSHQVELLDLFADLHEAGTTVVAVLHDLNHAARYATHLVVMKDGAVVTAGPPGDVLTAELVESVYGLACVVVPDPVTGTPMVVPRGREARRPR